MGRYGSVSVGRKNDRRFKLSESQIRLIKSLFESGKYNQRQLSLMFGCHHNTIRYYTDLVYRTQQQAKNAQRRRSKEEEHSQVANKQLRRDLVRHKVRRYTRKQMRDLRRRKAEHYRRYARLYARKWRKKHPGYWRRFVHKVKRASR